jgi:formamidopyrimidine-DNA glycosylase
MPELPEVETVCRGLNNLTLNQEIQGSEVLLDRSLAYPESILAFNQAIKGDAIAQWTRRGKYLLANLISGAKLGVHLRMTGQLLWVKDDSILAKHTRLRLFFPDDQELRFVDTRTFGKVWYIPQDHPVETIITGLQKLAVEPLSADFTVNYLIKKLAKRKAVIKTVLLNQEVIAGLGNIYADEVLFKSGINPVTLADQLTETQIIKLHQAIIEILTKAIENGGTTFSDFLNLLGVNGNYGNVAYVYRRTGEPCRLCGTNIERIKLGGRSTHFCPQCQIPSLLES